MIIGNNNSNNFRNYNSFRNQSQNNNNPRTSNNNFQNQWNTTQETNRITPLRKNVFVKNIQDQKYANSSDTNSMNDRSLAMLHDRLQKGTITLDEFNRKCRQLANARQNMNKNNKIF